MNEWTTKSAEHFIIVYLGAYAAVLCPMIANIVFTIVAKPINSWDYYICFSPSFHACAMRYDHVYFKCVREQMKFIF